MRISDLVSDVCSSDLIQTKPIRSRACQHLIMQNVTRAPQPFFRLSTPPKQARAPPAKWKARNSEDNRQQLHPIWNRMIEHIRTFMIWDAPTRDRSGSVWRSGIE